MYIETEATPNPATLKFLPGRQVMSAGTREFTSPEAAEASPLAQMLFDLGDVTGVFFGHDFVSVTAAPGVEWASLKPQVVAINPPSAIRKRPLAVFCKLDSKGAEPLCATLKLANCLFTSGDFAIRCQMLGTVKSCVIWYFSTYRRKLCHSYFRIQTVKAPA